MHADQKLEELREELRTIDQAIFALERLAVLRGVKSGGSSEARRDKVRKKTATKA